MDAAVAVDAQNAPTATWKTAENAVSHSAHTHHRLKERKNRLEDVNPLYTRNSGHSLRRGFVATHVAATQAPHRAALKATTNLMLGKQRQEEIRKRRKTEQKPATSTLEQRRAPYDESAQHPQLSRQPP
jgi:hypothetical protein